MTVPNYIIIKNNYHHELDKINYERHTTTLAISSALELSLLIDEALNVALVYVVKTT